MLMTCNGKRNNKYSDIRVSHIRENNFEYNYVKFYQIILYATNFLKNSVVLGFSGWIIN